MLPVDMRIIHGVIDLKDANPVNQLLNNMQAQHRRQRTTFLIDLIRQENERTAAPRAMPAAAAPELFPKPNQGLETPGIMKFAVLQVQNSIAKLKQCLPCS